MGTAFFLEGYEFPSDAGAYKLGYIPNAPELSIVSLSGTARLSAVQKNSILAELPNLKDGSERIASAI
jgi:hypothetical protein